MQNINPLQLRQDFPMYNNTANNFVYLDSAATSLTPAVVIDAMCAYYTTYRANVHRGMYQSSEHATQKYEAARQTVARFIHASPEEIIFTSGTTASLNLLAYVLCPSLSAGDEILISAAEHHANIVPWQEMAKRYQLVLKFIELRGDGTLDLDDARKKICARTKIISIQYASNVLGTIFPASHIVTLAHNVGAVCIIDAAQGVGHRAIDVRALDCDFLAFSAHKMYGPTGIGVLYGRREHLQKMPPFLFGGDMVREVRREYATWNDLPHKFEAGTPHIAGAIGLGAAIDYITGLGFDAIADHEQKMSAYAHKSLSAIEGLTIQGPRSSDRLGIFSFTLHGAHSHDIAYLLGERGICVRSGHHCAMPLMHSLGIADGTVRASISCTTTTGDIDALVSEICAIKKILGIA